MSGIDADGPGWVSQTQALEQECQLRNAPVEYLEALPWVTRGGQRWIHQDTLREWCGGDGVFADRPRLCRKIGKTATGAIGGDGD